MNTAAGILLAARTISSKLSRDWQGFWSFNPKIFFHVRARVGGVFQNGSDEFLFFERFWLGGMDSIAAIHIPIFHREITNTAGTNWRRPHGRLRGIYLDLPERYGSGNRPRSFDGGFNIDQRLWELIWINTLWLPQAFLNCVGARQWATSVHRLRHPSCAGL